MRDEARTISQIAKRAVAKVPELEDANGGILSLYMDIDHVHRQIGLKLDELLEADDLDFFHDVLGIYRHFNRQTMKLEDCFLPRFAKVGGLAA